MHVKMCQVTHCKGFYVELYGNVIITQYKTSTLSVVNTCYFSVMYLLLLSLKKLW